MAPLGTACTGRPLAVDLFAGTGSATAAFLANGWDVLELDLSAAVLRRRNGRPARGWRVVADVRALPLAAASGRPVAFLWASPPCTEFSDANPYRERTAERPSLDHVFATLAAVRTLRPRWWVLENVRGAIPFLGIPAQKIGPWCLWGYFPAITPSWAAATYRKLMAGRSAVARATVPYELSEALYQAVTRAVALPSLLDMRPFRRHRHRAARRLTAQLDALEPDA